MRHFTMQNKEQQQCILNTQEIACIDAMSTLLQEGIQIEESSHLLDISQLSVYELDSSISSTNNHTNITSQPGRPLVLYREQSVDGSADLPSVRDTKIVHSPFSAKSTYFPYHSKGAFVETFYTMVLKDFEQMCLNTTSIRNRNLSKEENIALKELCSLNNLVIRQADKGGGIVLQDRTDYLSEAFRLLGDNTSYIILGQDPMESFQKKYKDLLTQALNMNVINKSEFGFLYIRFPRTPIFYHIPKIHKHISNPPGRPIVSGVESMTSSVSQYVDYFLQPLVTRLKSYLRDTLHVLDSISGIIWKPTYIWATCDITSLYTCVKHNKGLEAVKHFLNLDTSLGNTQSLFILQAITFILEHNYFLFEDIYYLQICGTAMGTRFAPSYANLYMGLWEELHVWGDADLGASLVYYSRYIDDIILIWDGDQELLEHKLQAFNNNDMDLKFTYNVNKNTIVFLDLELEAHLNGEIITKTHFKTVATNSYLHNNSNHYKRWLANIPRGQFLRIRRNCSSHSDFLAQGEILVERFLAKGYDKHIILYMRHFDR
ncbi:uncharacterized protein LOC142485864 [Ascaphus truei]|uniref:uncharacterized protein LOC142485864 n=1 Tax=Ascaphus truei TaxID=8439 RepID=UPI003F596C1F